MAQKSLLVSEIRMMLTEEFNAIINEDEIEYDYYIPSHADGEINEIVLGLDISDEEDEGYRTFTKQTLAANKKSSYKFCIEQSTI